ncbi:hypothetical protein NE237_013975 [Protea cynaroides]|uniref:Uncharacterized protein n=1 Tax=Protea cynaroides TaxID=273540 RepID=A0A9Q0H3Z8_9MAGN|nr:hypothetical protein NE237_013975 [Protea cynaroides]
MASSTPTPPIPSPSLTIGNGAPPTTPPSMVISNITSFIPIKLSSSNYLWKSLIEPILRVHKLMHLIDRTTLSPVPIVSQWYEQDQMLLSWISGTLSETVLPYIVRISYAKKAWDLLN